MSDGSVCHGEEFTGKGAESCQWGWGEGPPHSLLDLRGGLCPDCELMTEAHLHSRPVKPSHLPLWDNIYGHLMLDI